MKKKFVMLLCAASIALCMTACGGDRDVDTDSSAAAAAQPLEAQESGVIEMPEGAEGQLR